MFSKDQDLASIQRGVLSLIRALVGICEREGIPYFICGGTLLGAARHGGFIPWDDDADFVMLRKDYRRLEKVLIDNPLPGTYWASVSNPAHFPTNHFFGKLCLKDSGIEDHDRGSLGVSHVFGIDVLPLDLRPAGAGARLRQRFFSYYYQHLSSLLFGGASRRHALVKRVLRPVLLPFYGSKEELASRFAGVAAIGETGASDGYVSLCGRYGYRHESFRPEWFGSTVPMQFEGLTLAAAVGWREMLELAYGKDWINPPKSVGTNRHYRLMRPEKRVAYLSDRPSVGGGGEYIRRQIIAHAPDGGRVLFAVRGECTAATVNACHPDRIHVNHLRSLLQLYRNPLCRPKAPVTFVVHGIHLRKYDFLPQTVANRIKRRLRLGLERWLYAKVDELVALNADDVKMLRETYRVCTPIRLEPNVVESVAPDAREPEFAFLTVARFDFQKGYDILLAAIALAQNELRAAKKRTLLIGGGETLGAMKAFAAEKGIADLVEFAGEIPNAAAEMWRGRILLAPSRWEGSPYAVLEAVARGKKVIASDCPGNEDVVKGDETGWLFPTGDAKALAELLVRK